MASERVLLRRSVILPTDLYDQIWRVAQADGFPSVQAWGVCALQRLVNERELKDANTPTS